MDFISAFQRMDVEELREQVINLLKEAYSDGRIDVDSLERRLKNATAARSKDELLALVADIPSPKTGNDPAFNGRDEERSWKTNDRVPRRNQTLFAVLGSSERTGRWQPAGQISAFSLLGSIKLDFREAEFPREGVTINAGCIMGSVELVVPPGINVDLTGIPLLGSMDNKSGTGDPGAPEITVKGLALMGSVEVKRKEARKPGETRRDRRRKRKARA